MTLLRDVAERLRHHGIPFALIGAAAMAVHGVSRATADLDLFSTDPRCLDDELWRPLAATVQMHRGDREDPVAGVVRARRAGEPDVDVLIGQASWHGGVTDGATPRGVHGVPVASLPNLILLKLYAGGSQDAWDVEQLLALDVAGDARAAVDRSVTHLPADSQMLWSRISGR